MQLKKKGQAEVLTTTLLFELIIGVLIAGTLAYAILNLNNTSKFNKEYLQEDLLLTKEMVKSLTGDLDMKYKTGNWCLNEKGEFVGGKNCQIQITKTGNEVIIKKG